MAAKWMDPLTGSLDQKKQYNQGKVRIEALPEPCATSAKTMRRFFTHQYYSRVLGVCSCS